AYAAGRPDRGNEADGPFSSSSSKDNRLPIQPKDLAVHVGDLTETGIVLHRVHQDRHHVAAVAARIRQLLEAPLDAAHVARGLEAADPLDLLGFHALVDA